jgi:[ribosomal protein S18]-alanine N-acetyltransferase
MIDLQKMIIRRFLTVNERDEAAWLMMSSDPWRTFGRTYENCLDAVTNPLKEAYGAFLGEDFLGLLVIDLSGPFKGYLQAVCVKEEARGQGVGGKLIHFAEERIFRVSPNCFLCYSDFNDAVRPVYDRLGYEQVGILKDYMIAGHDEILMRKSIGPVMAFLPPKDQLK